MNKDLCSEYIYIYIYIYIHICVCVWIRWMVYGSEPKVSFILCKKSSFVDIREIESQVFVQKATFIELREILFFFIWCIYDSRKVKGWQTKIDSLYHRHIRKAENICTSLLFFFCFLTWSHFQIFLPITNDYIMPTSCFCLWCISRPFTKALLEKNMT